MKHVLSVLALVLLLAGCWGDTDSDLVEQERDRGTLKIVVPGDESHDVADEYDHISGADHAAIANNQDDTAKVGRQAEAMAHADAPGEHDMQHDGHDLSARSPEHARDHGEQTDQHGTVLALDGNVDDAVRTQTMAGTEASPETGGAPETPVSHPHVPVYSPALLTEFTLKASGRPHEGVPPKVALAVGGKRIAEWLVTSSFDEDQWATYSFLVPGDQLDDLTLQYLNDVGRRDLWVRDITIGGQPIDLATATYVRANRDAIPGQSLMAWRGELQFRNIRIR